MVGLKTKLICPKCKETFNYEFIPGASLYSIKLGNYRYMKCPKCKKWSIFNITKNLPRKQKRTLGLYGLLLGSLLLFLGMLFFLRGLKLSLLSVEITSIIILFFSTFIIISGIFNLIKSRNKKNFL